jgi:hypothetical protein
MNLEQSEIGVVLQSFWQHNGKSVLVGEVEWRRLSQFLWGAAMMAESLGELDLAEDLRLLDQIAAHRADGVAKEAEEKRRLEYLSALMELRSPSINFQSVRG